MEFIPRCNDLKCRQQLHDQAIVTTCSHVFCPQCAETTGLSRATVAQRTCPACNAPLHDQDDVVMTSLNPSEEYKTTLLSGLSPTVIMECASRGLAFHSYQTSQEIIYQEHLSRGLTDKYNTLSQQMDQLIHDANAQIKGLQEKMQAMQTEYAALDAKNNDLVDAFREKSRSQQHIQKLYQSLKAQVMASHVASAAGDEAELTLQTAKGHRFIDRIPGTRMGSASYGANGSQQMGGRKHGRADSRSSGDGGHLRAGSSMMGPSFAAHLQRRGIGARIGCSAKQPASAGTPSQTHHSRLPVLGGARQTQHGSLNIGPSYQASPVVTQNVEASIGRSLDNFSVGGSARMSGGAGGMPLGR